MGALPRILWAKKRWMLSLRRKRLLVPSGVVGKLVRGKLWFGFLRRCLLGMIRRVLVITVGRRLRRQCRPVKRMRRISSGLIRLQSALPILGLATPASHRTVRP